MKIPKIKSMHVDALVRRDVAEKWQEVNPVLSADELGYELDTNIFRLGDGRTAWVDLPKYTIESAPNA